MPAPAPVIIYNASNGTFTYDPTNAAVFRDAAGRTPRPTPSPTPSPTTTASPRRRPPSPSTSPSPIAGPLAAGRHRHHQRRQRRSSTVSASATTDDRRRHHQPGHRRTPTYAATKPRHGASISYERQHRHLHLRPDQRRRISRRCRSAPPRPTPSPTPSPTTTAFLKRRSPPSPSTSPSPIPARSPPVVTATTDEDSADLNGQRLADHRRPPATPSAWPPAYADRCGHHAASRRQSSAITAAPAPSPTTRPTWPHFETLPGRHHRDRHLHLHRHRQPRRSSSTATVTVDVSVTDSRPDRAPVVTASTDEDSADPQRSAPRRPPSTAGDPGDQPGHDYADLYGHQCRVTAPVISIQRQHRHLHLRSDQRGRTSRPCQVGTTAIDTFTYTVTDNHGASSTATVTVDRLQSPMPARAPPVVTASTDEDTPILNGQRRRQRHRRRARRHRRPG